MLLAPKKYKFSKSFSGKKITKKNYNKKPIIRFSNICFVAEQSGFLTNFQLEALRRFLRRYLKKKAQIFFRLFVTTPITKKPNEVRLGRGKGGLKYWAVFVKKGDVILELRCVNKRLAISCLSAARVILPFKTFLFNRQNRWIF